MYKKELISEANISIAFFISVHCKNVDIRFGYRIY